MLILMLVFMCSCGSRRLLVPLHLTNSARDVVLCMVDEVMFVMLVLKAMVSLTRTANDFDAPEQLSETPPKNVVLSLRARVFIVSVSPVSI